MPVTYQEVQSQAIELSAKAFEVFCEDISGMFGVDISCERLDICTETTAGLKKRFKKLVAVNCVKTDGVLNGQLHLIFDQGGLFTLSGVIVMLPENRILEEIKRGTIQDVASMNDAVKEIGNLLVGSWDRVFRGEMTDHGHFVQTSTYIGTPWDNPKETIGLDEKEELIFVCYEMTIGSYPSFICGVIFSQKIFEPQAEAAESQQDSAQVDAVSTKTIKESVPVEEKIQPVKINSEQSAAAIQSQPSVELSVQIHSAGCARDIMDKNVSWCLPDETVEQAIIKMQQNNAGYLLIGNAGELEGIVSRSNITGAISPYLRPVFAKWRRPIDNATLKIKLKWIMSRPVHTIKPDTTVEIIVETLCRLGCRCLPVVNQEGKVEGLVTVFDIFRILNANRNISNFGRTMQVPPFI
jgi:CBS domain-containing protein